MPPTLSHTRDAGSSGARAPQIALGELYDRHAGRCFSLAREICLDAHRAERAVSRVFVEIGDVAQGAGTHPPSAATLLLRTCRYAEDEARHSGQAYAPFPGLSPGQGQIMVLVRFGHLDCSEIAGALGVPPEGVKRLLGDGLHALRCAA